MTYDSTNDTLNHVSEVKKRLYRLLYELEVRATHHDDSKLEDPEKSYFDKYTPKLQEVDYGSDEYHWNLEEMKPALDHHYEMNRHHPEHFKKYICNGCSTVYYSNPDYPCVNCGYSQFQEEVDISQMHLVDLLEMVCDWDAATKRHPSGDIYNSIEINQERYGFSDELKSILISTVKLLESEFYNDEEVFSEGERR